MVNLCKCSCSSSDMWAVGVIAFLLLSGYAPFASDDPNEELCAVMNAKYEFIPHYWDSISIQAKDFVSQLLQLDPLHRLTAKSALCHPWIVSATSIDSSKDILPSIKPLIEERKNKRFKKVVGMIKVARTFANHSLIPPEVQKQWEETSTRSVPQPNLDEDYT